MTINMKGFFKARILNKWKKAQFIILVNIILEQKILRRRKFNALIKIKRTILIKQDRLPR